MTSAFQPKNRASALPRHSPKMATAGVMTPQTAPNAVAQPQRTTARLPITESQAAKIGLLNQWRIVTKRQADRVARRAQRLQLQAQAATELKMLVAKLLEHAITKEWGQRKLAAETGIPQTTLRRCRDGQADPVVWLPRVQAAASKLNSTNHSS